MKRFHISLLVLMLIFALVGCGSNNSQSPSTPPPSDNSQSSVSAESGKQTNTENSEQSKPQEPTSEKQTNTENSEQSKPQEPTSEKQADAENAEQSKPPEQTDTSNANATVESNSNKKILIAYFSATGNTKSVATYLAEDLDADVYEIVAADVYTTTDLNYNDSNSRATKEMNDSSARPAISGSVDDMAGYDVIFIGYPIWWGQAPRIINTYLESYDFGGKTIVPFCTSASSGIGTSATTLKKAMPNSTWLDGKRFSANLSHSDVTSWVDSLNLKQDN